jgi:hypothetical protein
MKSLLQCLPLLTALALVSGCAPSLPARLRDARTGAYVFHHPAPDVESAARALLRDDGFQLIGTYKGGIIRTEWRAIIDDEQFSTAFERYDVVIQRLSPAHCRVTALKWSIATLGMETAHPHASSNRNKGDENGNTITYGKGKVPLPMGTPGIRRDLELEWRLIAREEPARAQLVQSDIDWLIAHH